MTLDITHPTNAKWKMFDPEKFPPPQGGESLLLINAGGVLIIGPWHDTCLAWAKKPVIPDSVKARETAKAEARAVALQQRLLAGQREPSSPPITARAEGSLHDFFRTLRGEK